MSKVDKSRAERIARIAKALAHPTRVSILQFLAGENSCYFGDISEIVPVSNATISQHLSELKSAGLIHGEIIPPKSSYCINREAWAEVDELFSGLIAGCLDKKNCGCK